MKILVVGGGGREHAIIKALSESARKPELFCAPGNGGTARLAQSLPVRATDVEGIVSAAKKINADLVFVASDDPLALGCVDALEATGIRVFGPRKSAAAIESDKVFAKHFMKRHNIPTASFEVFSDSASAVEYIRNRDIYPVVIKAQGLALGKGAVIAVDFEAAKAAVKSIIEDKAFGSAGDNIVVEEFMTGREVTVLAFTDGKCVKPMPASQDHKRAFDNDMGLNTGGMGAVSPVELYTPEIAARAEREIFAPTIGFMREEGREFRGVIYFEMMITADGPKVIEYNARFGDPEAQTVLPLLKSDLLDVIDAVLDRRLSDFSVEWKTGASACVVMASGGYPGKYETGLPVSGIDDAESDPDVTVYHAGTRNDNGVIVTAGGRVLGISATGTDLPSALARAYTAADKIRFEGAHMRRDIGQYTKGN